MDSRSLLIVLWVCMASQALAQRDKLTITLAGDFGMNANKAEPSKQGGFSMVSQDYLNYSEMTDGVKHLFKSDLNIVNLESTVLHKLPNEGLPHKGYLFSTHPSGIEHMAKLGVNMWTLANNHVWDYGEQGLCRTLENLDCLGEGKFKHVGAGHNFDQAKAVRLIRKKRMVIAVGSIGIIDDQHHFHRADENTPGTLTYRNRNGFEDYELVLDELAAAKANYRILAIHYGTEYNTSLDYKQRERFELALSRGKADLIVGHHPHVVRPVEIVEHDGRKCIIAYSLGNFLHPGTGNIEYRSPPHNFGMVLKLDFHLQGHGRKKSMTPTRIEMVPLLGMHHKPFVPEGKKLESLVNSYNWYVAYDYRNLKFELDSETGRAVHLIK